MTKEIGQRLGQIADELYGGNRAELARQIDMKPPSFTKYTSGNTMPGGEVLWRISRLGVSINWLLTGEGSMFLEDKQPSAVGEPEKHYDANGSDLRSVGSHQMLEMIDDRSGEPVFRIEINVYAGPTMRLRARTVREE